MGLNQFERYVGIAYEASRLDIDWLRPTEESLRQGNDREIVCYLYDLNLRKLVGSTEDSRE